MVKKRLDNIEYYQMGRNPKLLLLSGTHGDEYEVINSVKRYLKRQGQDLPPFLFIPEVSPSAVSAKTRNNTRNLDINRCFFKNSSDGEIKTNIVIISQYRYDLAVSFHEDPDIEEFYLYDSHLLENKVLKKLKTRINELGVKLFNGIDDEEDPSLGNQIRQGYASLSGRAEEHQTGMFMDWALRTKTARRVLVPELPGKAGPKIKNKIIEVIFELLIKRL